MARPRPRWRAPFKPYPKGAGPGIHPAMLAKRTAFGDFSEGSGRRQCGAIKANGERCRRDCVQGVDRCRYHKGVGNAFQHARALDPRVRRAANGHKARQALAKIAFEALATEPQPEIGGITAYGRYIEAKANRLYDPETYRQSEFICQKVLKKSRSRL